VRLRLTGPATSILEGIPIRNAGAVDADFSATGTMVYTAGSGGVEYLNWVTRDGAHTPVDTSWTTDFITHALSPDGRRAVVSVTREGASRDLWIKELDQGPLTRFTFDGVINARPEWTTDGKAITFISDRSGKNALYMQRADGNGAPTLLLTTKQEPRAIAEGFWSRDGKWLVYRTEPGEAGAGDIMGFRPAIDSAPMPLVATPFREATPALSPDGRWLAYVSSESGTSEVYVRPFPNVGEGRWQVSVGSGREPVWARNGRQLFYKGGEDMLMAATISTQGGFTVQDRKALLSASDYDNDEEHPRYNVSPDDKRFLMSRRNTGSGSELVLVLNWFTGLRARFGANR
jgi:serine/threonine-protein kinase